MISRLPVRNRLTCPTRRKACFPGTIWHSWSEGLCSLVAMCVSRFRNCVCAEWNRIGGRRKKRGSQTPQATLRREIHAAQEVLKARLGAQEVQRAASSRTNWSFRLSLSAVTCHLSLFLRRFPIEGVDASEPLPENENGGIVQIHTCNRNARYHSPPDIRGTYDLHKGVLPVFLAQFARN